MADGHASPRGSRARRCYDRGVFRRGNPRVFGPELPGSQATTQFPPISAEATEAAHAGTPDALHPCTVTPLEYAPMESSGTVSTQAPEAVDAILALVGLDTCLYTARSRGGRCAVRVDYISDDGWKSATFCLGSEILQQSLNDAALRQQLADAWQHRLSVARAISPVQVGRQFTPPTRH